MMNLVWRSSGLLAVAVFGLWLVGVGPLAASDALQEVFLVGLVGRCWFGDPLGRLCIASHREETCSCRRPLNLLSRGFFDLWLKQIAARRPAKVTVCQRVYVWPRCQFIEISSTVQLR